MEGFIYLIESSKNKKLYLGSTNNPAFRIKEHNKGFCHTTKTGIPWKCILIIKIGDLTKARKVEYYIKQQKEKLIIQNILRSINRYFDKTNQK